MTSEPETTGEDSPTASLDARAEHELFERLGTLLAGRISGRRAAA